MSDTDRDALRSLAAAYALDALESDEKREFEALLETSPDLQREVAEYREVSALLALGVPGAASPPSWEGVEERIAGGQTWRALPLRKGERRMAPWVRLGWAAAAAAVIGLGILGIRAQDLSRRLVAAEETIDQVTAQLARREGVLNEILGATTTFTLASAGAPEPTIRVWWNRESDVWVLHASNLPPAAPDRAYQLWFIQAGEPVPSRTFNSDQDGRALLTVPGPGDMPGLTHAAVTEEPAGGSQQPTTTPILVGAVAR